MHIFDIFRLFGPLIRSLFVAADAGLFFAAPFSSWLHILSRVAGLLVLLGVAMTKE